MMNRVFAVARKLDVSKKYALRKYVVDEFDCSNVSIDLGIVTGKEANEMLIGFKRTNFYGFWKNVKTGCQMCVKEVA